MIIFHYECLSEKTVTAVFVSIFYVLYIRSCNQLFPNKQWSTDQSSIIDA